jgi:hypothetical protein
MRAEIENDNMKLKVHKNLTVAPRLQRAPIQRCNTLIMLYTVLALFLTVFRRLQGLLAPSGAQAGHGSGPWAGTGFAAASRCLVLTTYDTNNAREPSAAPLRKLVSMSRWVPLLPSELGSCTGVGQTCKQTCEKMSHLTMLKYCQQHLSPSCLSRVPLASAWCTD